VPAFPQSPEEFQRKIDEARAEAETKPDSPTVPVEASPPEEENQTETQPITGPSEIVVPSAYHTEYSVPKPADLGATSFAPPVNPSPGGALPATEATLSSEGPPPFEVEYRKHFEQLMNVGTLQSDFTWMGHTFRLTSVTADQLIKIGMLMKPSEGTLGETRSYQAAYLAASWKLLDGKPLPTPLPLSAEEDPMEITYRWILKLSPWALDAIHQEYLKLEYEEVKILDAMGKVYRRES